LEKDPAKNQGTIWEGLFEHLLMEIAHANADKQFAE
jgi:hypothetical protein